MFTSVGKLLYSENPIKLILQVDQQIGAYYLSTIPKYFNVKKQLWSSHISIIRNEKIINIDSWGKFEGKLIQFEYEHYLYNDNLYFWLQVICPSLKEIRIGLGLNPTSNYTKSPNGRHDFHITIGNTKRT